MAQPHVPIPHLWIVATEPLPANDRAIIVNLTTLRNYSDETVILGPGEHPFIKQKSVIYFHGSLVIDLKQAVKGFEAGICTLHRPCSAQLIQRIQQGLLASTHTKNEVKGFYRRTITAPAKHGS